MNKLIVKNLFCCGLVLTTVFFSGNCFSASTVNAQKQTDAQILKQKVAQAVIAELAENDDDDFSIPRQDESLNGPWRTKMQKKVSCEIKRQIFQQQRDRLNAVVYSDTKNSIRHQPSVIYKVPNWPFSSLVYEQKDLIQVSMRGSFAGESYASRGSTQNLSNLIFSQEPITIQDILLVSKLANAGKLAAVGSALGVGGNPDLADFKTLADQPLVFDASTWQIAGSVNFARHFRKGDISCGVQLPLVYRRNNLKLISSLSETKRTALIASGGRFANLSLQEILDLILTDKGIEFNDDSSQTGISDIIAFFHYQVPTKKCERLVFGLEAVFPTARERNTGKLWDPELGNGGFNELSAFGSALWSVYRFFNPHLHARCTYSFPAEVLRRIPKEITFDGENPVNRPGGEIPDDIMILASNVKLVLGQPFDQLDTTVRGFADNAQKVRIGKGAEFSLRVGNIFERCLFRRAFFDVHYDLRMKGKDHLGFRQSDDEFDPTILTTNTFQVEHRLGADYSYQFDNFIRLGAGADYSFAGSNIAKTFEARLACSVEF